MAKKTSSVQAQISKAFRNYVHKHFDWYPEGDAFLEALQTWPVKAVRANTHVTTIEDLARLWNIPCDYVPWCKDAIYFEWDQKVGSSDEHQRGLCYVSDPSAMVVVECADIQPDMTVVDMCAAPGGKSTHVMNNLGLQGRLVSNDVNTSRVKTLQENIDRILYPIDASQTPHVEVTSLSSDELAQRYEGQADVVILDAPCSGEAMMRRSNTARRQWSENLCRKMSELQKELLSCAATIIKPGGTVVYSTCTFNAIENDDVVSQIDSLRPRNGEEIAQSFNNSEHFVVRPWSVSLFPHYVEGDGQSVSMLTR